MPWLAAALLALWLLVRSVRSFLSDAREEGREQALGEAERDAQKKALTALEVDSRPVPADKSDILAGLRHNPD